jgi:hypothetical protein
MKLDFGRKVSGQIVTLFLDKYLKK